MMNEIRIEEVAVHYVRLHRGSKSGKTLECNCPFHVDSQRSMKIRVTEQTYECMVCKEKGDALDFIQNMEGCSHKEVMGILVDWKEGRKKEYKYLQPKKDKKRNTFLDIHLLNEYKMLLDSLEPYVVDDFLLTGAFLRFEAGIAPEILPVNYKDLAGKLVFPVRDELGRLNNFVTSHTSETEEIEHCCLSDGFIDSALFGLFQSLEGILCSGFVYLVRNCEDVLVMHAAGFTNTIAYCGIELTMSHISQILKYTNQAVLVHSEDIQEQVYSTKMTARLSFASIQVSNLSLPANYSLQKMYRQMHHSDFEYYVRQATRLSRLKSGRDDLLCKLEEATLRQKEVKSIEERINSTTSLLSIRSKLNKISSILTNYSVVI